MHPDQIVSSVLEPNALQAERSNDLALSHVFNIKMEADTLRNDREPEI
jgi:hypothetical protein